MAAAIPISSDTDYNAEKLIVALIAKHRDEIDRIIEMKSEEQEQEIKKYGLNPQAIKDYYKDFQVENARLRRETARVDSNAFKAGWATLLATFAGIGSLNPKYFGGKESLFKPKEILGGRFMKWAVATVTSIVAGFGGNFAVTHFAGKDTEHESTVLVHKARSALERELAMGIEKTQQQAKAELPVPLAVYEPAPQTSLTEKNKVGIASGSPGKLGLMPRQNYRAEAAKEKAAAQTAAAHVS